MKSVQFQARPSTRQNTVDWRRDQEKQRVFMALATLTASKSISEMPFIPEVDKRVSFLVSTIFPELLTTFLFDQISISRFQFCKSVKKLCAQKKSRGKKF